MKNTVSIEGTFLPFVQNSSSSLSIDIVDNQLSIRGYDKFIQDLDRNIALVENYEYNDDDKSTIKKVRSEVNKVKDYLKSNFNSNKDFFLNNYVEQQKEIFNKLDKLIKLLSSGVEEHENRLKTEKYNSLNQQFTEILKNDYIDLYDEELVFTDVLNPKWTNLSAKEKDSLCEMKDRLMTLNMLFTNKDCPVKDVKLLVKQLDLNNYNGLLVLSKLQDAEKKRLEDLEKERLYKEAQLLKKESVVENNIKQSTTTVSENKILVRFKESDWNKVKTILTASNIDFTVID